MAVFIIGYFASLQGFLILGVGVMGQKQLTLSLSGPKELPVGGFILKQEESSPRLSNVENQIVALYRDFKDIKKEINDLHKDSDDSKSDSVEVGNLRNRLNLLENVVRERNEGYIGCFKDDAKRHLKYKLQTFGNTSLAKCRDHCKGYKYLGLQDSQACLCGNTLLKKEYPRVKESECYMACKGEPKRKCGGPLRNSIYLV